MDIDCELKYCPSCKDEYRAEIETCAGCDIPLVWGRDLQKSSNNGNLTKKSVSQITEADRLITLLAGSLLEMKKVKRLLEKNGVDSILVKDEQNCRKSCCGGDEIQLQVRHQDREPAEQVLRIDFVKTTALQSYDHSTAGEIFDPAAELAICPACGHQFTPEGPACPDCGLNFL